MPIDDKVSAFLVWVQATSVDSCRWVEYVGVKMIGAIDVPLDDVEKRMRNALCEGRRVDWNEQGGTMFLRIWDGDVEPTWDKVFAEESLADIDEILRQAGFAEDE